MFSGIVIHSKGVGKTFGYPTANLDLNRAQVRLTSGVYAALAVKKHEKFKAALIINVASDGKVKVEVHFLDYNSRDFYGEYIEIQPVQKVSEIECYDQEEELKAKISKDIQLVRELFAAEAKV